MQLKKNKKKKVSNFGKKKSYIRKTSLKRMITKEDREYLLWLQTQTHEVCFVCGKNNPSDKIEWHHVKRTSSDAKNHKRLIPLCGTAHHRAGFISPHANPSKWRELYSMEVQLEYAKNIYERYKKEMNVQ
jgi:hypothetical protein